MDPTSTPFRGEPTHPVRRRPRTRMGEADVCDAAVIASVMLAAAGSIVVLMLVTWLFSLALHDASIVDPIWPLGFVVIAWVVLAVADGYRDRQLLIVGLVTI